MTTRLLAFALLLLPTLCAAQSIKVQVRVPASQATFDVAVPTGPTAEDLSKPGALQEWIDTSLQATGRVQLPEGVIKTDPIVIRRLHGGKIEGVGPTYAPPGVGSGWATDRATQAVTTIIANDPSKPLVTLEDVINTTLEGFGLKTDGVGILYVNGPGFGSSYLRLTRVAFWGGTVGFQAGEKQSDKNCADVLFDQCLWSQCKTGFLCVNTQGMNYHFVNQCWWLHTPRAVVFDDGGNSILRDCCGYGVGTWLTVNSGGGNLSPIRISNLFSDRNGDIPPAVIVDCSEAIRPTRVVVDGVRVTRVAGDAEKWTGRGYYYLPKRFPESRIAHRHPDDDVYPDGADIAPTIKE